MCGPCDGVFKKLKNRQVNCGINGCKHKWTWTTDEQIQAYATGKPNEPPRRMCDECKTGFGAIADREVRCRTSGCKKTWTWSRGDQLDACLAGKPAPKAPRRMCQSCLDIYSKLKDVERPCRRTDLQADLDRQARRPAGARGARQDRRSLSALLPRVREGAGRARGSAGPLQDRPLHGHLDLDQRAAAGGRRAPGGEGRPGRSARGADERPPKLPSGAGDGAQPEASGRRRRARRAGERRRGACRAARRQRRPAAQGQGKGRKGRGRNRKRRREPRPPERRCEACIEFLKDRKTHEIPCSQLRDRHLLAAGEPAADAPRQLGRAVAVRRVQARRDRGGARRSARGAAPSADAGRACARGGGGAGRSAGRASSDAPAEASSDVHPPLHEQAEPAPVSESPS